MPESSTDRFDSDEAPQWTDEMFDRADRMYGDVFSRRGRPPGLAKIAVSLRLDPEVLDAFRAGGPGRQTRINDALRRAAGV